MNLTTPGANAIITKRSKCASGGIGRLAGFRCQCSQGRAGSTPASRTKTKEPVFGLVPLFWASPRRAWLAPFYHLTAEVNSAYDNSPLCSELTPHLRRLALARLWVQIHSFCAKRFGIQMRHISHVGAHCAAAAKTSLRTGFCFIRSMAHPFQTRPAALGSRLRERGCGMPFLYILDFKSRAR